jgi:hypothetical protein
MAFAPDAAPDAAPYLEPYVDRKPPRLTHLGTRADERDARQYKFGHSYTMRFNQRPTAKTAGERCYTLVQDARRAAQLTLLVLTRMQLAFRRELGSTLLVGPKLFRRVMRRFHIGDRLLIQRLFDGFSEYGSRVDYREFIRTFACACADATVVEKLDLILDVRTPPPRRRRAARP